MAEKRQQDFTDESDIEKVEGSKNVRTRGRVKINDIKSPDEIMEDEEVEVPEENNPPSRKRIQTEEKEKSTWDIKIIALLLVGVIVLVVILAFKFLPKLTGDKTPSGILIGSTEDSDDFNPDAPIEFDNDTTIDESTQEPEPYLTEADRNLLRSWGYTSAEIEQFEIDNVDAQQKADEAKEAFINNRLEVYRSFVRNSNDNSNQQYHYVLANSWWGQEPQVLDKNNKEVESYTSKANVDYFKYPPQGKQYFIKIRFTNDDIVLFVNVPALVYHSLKDEGNCLITYDFSKIYGVETYSNIKVVLE